MPITFNPTGSGNKSIAAIYFNDGAATRTLTNVYYNDGTATRLVWTAGGAVPASVVMAPAGDSSSLASGAPYSKAFTATVSNGVGPFTYLWTKSGTNQAIFTLTNATTATCTVTASGASNVNRVMTLTCTVTDTGSGSTTCFDAEPIDVTWGVAM